jgi:LPXTG-site transpeptidase (sortase) family protein
MKQLTLLRPKAISVILILVIASAGLASSIFTVGAATAPDLGAAASYSVLSGSIVTNTGPSKIEGNVGVSASIGVPPHITGFPPGIIGPPGVKHDADAHAAAAQAANTAVFTFIDQPCSPNGKWDGTGLVDLVGKNLVPGVYCADQFSLTGTLTLSGSGVWIFKSASDFVTSGTANVVGGNALDVWWRVVSSATLGTNTSLIGNILASTSIWIKTGASLNGRALSQTGAVTLDNATIYGPICLAKTATAAALTASPTPTPTPTPTPRPTSTPAVLPNSGFPMGKVSFTAGQRQSVAARSNDLTLKVSRLDLNLELVNIPQVNGAWDVSWLSDNQAGHMEGSTFPTLKGNSVITAHVWNAFDEAGPFHDLKNLRYNDEIQILAFGHVYTYRVRNNFLVRPDDLKSSFAKKNGTWVTLMTCEGYDAISETYASRRLVRAVLVKID